MITQQLSGYENVFVHTSGGADDANFIALMDSLSRLSTGSFGGVLASFNAKATHPLYITADASIPELAGRTSFNTIIGTNSTRHLSFFDVGYLIYIAPDEISGIEAQGFGADFHMGLDRLLYHEIFHALDHVDQLSDLGTETTDNWTDPVNNLNFVEEIAVFAENFLYASNNAYNNGDDGIRLGHLKGPALIVSDDNYDEGGASGLSGFSGFAMARTFVDGGDFFSFTAMDSATGFTNTKTYHRPGYDLFGDGSIRTTYDHYIRYEAKGGRIDFRDPHDVTKPTNLEAMLPDVMFADAGTALKTVADVFSGVNHLFDGYRYSGSIGASSIRQYADALGITRNGQIATDHDMQANRFVGIGSDRWGDTGDGNNKTFVDLSGPVQSGSTYPTADVDGLGPLPPTPSTTTSAARLGIDDRASTVGTVLAGASGYVLDGNPLLPGDGYLDASDSSDWLIAGTGDDILIMGTGGLDPANANYGYGNGGRDVLVGRAGIDNLFGGDGNDMFSPGSGEDYIVGGAGLDTLSYHESTKGVWLNLTSQTGLLGDAAGDSWRGIEKFIGSAYDDTFIGVGGAFMAGMEGNDAFHMKNGDVAFGGAGADSFYLEIAPGAKTSVGIIDLDPSDRIYVNGNLFQGWPTYAAGTGYNPVMTGYVVYDGDQPGHPLMPETLAKIAFTPSGGGGIYGPPPSSVSVLDIYIAGYTGGDGGLWMSPSNEYVAFPFQPFDLI